MRLAADQLREAVADFLAGFGNKRKWDKIDGKLDKSIAHFRAVTIKVTGAAKR